MDEMSAIAFLFYELLMTLSMKDFPSDKLWIVSIDLFQKKEEVGGAIVQYNSLESSTLLGKKVLSR